MKKTTGLPIHTSILILMALSMGLNLIPPQSLKAATETDSKISLAMEKIKQELRQDVQPAAPVQGDIKNEFPAVAQNEVVPSSPAGEVSPEADERAKAVPLKKVEPSLPPAEDETFDISLKEQLEKVLDKALKIL